MLNLTAGVSKKIEIGTKKNNVHLNLGSYQQKNKIGGMVNM